MISLRPVRAAGLLLPLALLVSCSGDPDPKDGPSGSPSSSASNGTSTNGEALALSEKADGESVTTVERRCDDLGKNYVAYAQLDVARPLSLTGITFAGAVDLLPQATFISPTADTVPRTGLVLESLPRKTKQKTGWKNRQQLGETLHLDPGHYTWYLEFRPGTDAATDPHYDGVTLSWTDADGEAGEATREDDTTFTYPKKCRA